MLTYADWTASGRGLSFVEELVQEAALPVYANTRTESSYTGNYMTELREVARKSVARAVGADPQEYATIFVGTGCTGAINLLVQSLNLRPKRNPMKNPIVFVGPYEHNSNYLPWKETGVRVERVPEDLECGGPSFAALEKLLNKRKLSNRMIATFSAASNVTGIVT